LVSLPCAPRPATGAHDRTEVVALPGRKVAVVDDEPAVATTTERLVRHFGYRATALSARAVLDSFDAQPHAFDLVLTDQKMPDMTGLELGQALRARGVQVPVLLVTGLPAEVDPAAISPPFAVLSKPYQAEELDRALATLLADARGLTVA
jgi:CheY-like chemotaxis protein